MTAGKRTFMSAGCWAAVVVALVGGCVLAEDATPAVAEKPAFHWQKTDDSLALLNGDKIVWQSHHKKGEFKHYFHPVALLDGTTLTCHRPPDHPWHLGLWFSWKYLNKINYWEEDKKTGLPAGRTEILDVNTKANDDFSAQLVLTIAYHPPNEKPILTETRTIRIGAPDAAGRYHIDWNAVFTAGDKDVAMDRTPPNKSKAGVILSGGYAGLALRLGIVGFQNEVYASDGKKSREKVSGKTCRWAAFDMTPPAGSRGTIAILGHPGSLRYPEPCYAVNPDLKANPKATPYAFLMPAILANEPYTLPAGKSLTLRYRIFVQPGAADPAELDTQAKAFAETKE